MSRQWNYDRKLCSWKTKDCFISVPHMRKVKPAFLGADMRDCLWKCPVLGLTNKPICNRTDSHTLRERVRLGHKFIPAACLHCLVVHMRIAAMAIALYCLQGIREIQTISMNERRLVMVSLQHHSLCIIMSIRTKHIAAQHDP